MKQIYDFNQHEAPRLNETMLQEQLRLRELKKQTTLLRIAALLSCVCYAVFAFFIIRDSVAAAVASILMCTFTLIGTGIISVVFHRYGMRDQN